MKKRIAIIGAILSLIPFGQSLFIQNFVVLSFTGWILVLPENVYAESFEFYFDRGFDKGEKGDHYGAISDFTKAIEIDSSYGLAYSNRGYTKGIGFSDDEGACDDFKKAASLGNNFRINWLKTSAGKWCRNM